MTGLNNPTRTARTNLDTLPRANLPTVTRPVAVGFYLPVPVVGLSRWNQALAQRITMRNRAS